MYQPLATELLNILTDVSHYDDQPITEDVADTYFQHHVGEFNDHIRQSPGFTDLDQGTQAALTSFAYNTGPNVFTAPKVMKLFRVL